MTARYSQFFALAAVAALSSGGLAGCKAETLEEFEGTPQSKSVDYVSGENYQIEGLNGEVRLERAALSTKATVEFKPFVFQGYTEDEDEAQRAMDLLIFTLEKNAGTIFAKTDIDESLRGKSVGAHMLVEVPAVFNGGIQIDNENGEVEVDFVGNATSLIVENDGAGECLIQGSPTVRTTNVRCGFRTVVKDVSGDVTVYNDGLGDTEVSIAEVGGAGGHIRAESGAVNLLLPASGNYSVQATSVSGVVNTGAVPSTCNVQEAAANSKTVTCGTGGPNYLADADDDVNLGYR